ncbi:MAG: hypothetical protein DRJ11_09500 [Candidatus Aminicenantes bacterium]|nr:hypothetical protein [Candidatus Aminicenantes bacterium]RLE01486.1 MAG: hypothetical protein DRJ11_09500 [Candidatus Aminicenantes bacterium]
MSLVITVYVPEGIVMASDSRQFLTVEVKTHEGKDLKIETPTSDAVTKTLLLEDQRTGVSYFGAALLAGVPIASHIKKFIEEEMTAADDIISIPKKLINYFRKLFPDTDTGFHVAGYKKEIKISIPHVYFCHVGRNIVERRNINPDGSIRYGATWSGEIDILTSILNPVTIKDESGRERVIRPVAPIAWDGMTLQDAIDFSIYAIQTTIDTMRFQARPKTVGGPIDVLLLTPEEVRWIQCKELHGK